MTKLGSMAALAALAMVASPAQAGVRDAAFASSGDRARTEAATFAGATYRRSLDGRGPAADGRLSFKFAGASRSSTEAALRIGAGVELGVGAAGEPKLRIGGMDSRQIGRRMNLSGTQTALIVGGTLLIVAAVVLTARDKMDDWTLDY